MVDLSTLQTDSIALPEWEVPEFGELPVGPSGGEHRWPRSGTKTPGARASLALEGTHCGSRWSRLGAGVDGVP